MFIIILLLLLLFILFKATLATNVLLQYMQTLDIRE